MRIHDTYLKTMVETRDMDRLVFFSDAVFAIAMTLLIVELRIPDVPGAELGPALTALIPGYLTFVLSFVVVGIAWMSHHRKFHVIIRQDRNLPRINLLLLLFVATVPLPTGILGRYGDTVPAVCLYAATISALGFSLTLIWVHSRRQGLIDEALPEVVYRYVLVQSLPVPTVFAFSIPLALVAGATAAEIAWAASFLFAVVVRLTYGRRQV